MLAVSQLVHENGSELQVAAGKGEKGVPTPVRQGLVIPNRYRDFRKGSLVGQMSRSFQVQEQKAYHEIKILKSQIDLTQNEETKSALSHVLMDKLEAFEKLRRVHRTRMEAFYRIELFNQNKLVKHDNTL